MRRLHGPKPHESSARWDESTTRRRTSCNIRARFLGGYTSIYSPRALEGTFFSQADNGGYFDGNPTTAVTPDASGRILIAQFTLLGATSSKFTPFLFSGTLAYNDEATGDLTIRSFKTGKLYTPAPGGLAVLTLFGVGRSRRRCHIS